MRLATGARHTCGLDNTGRAFCWGYNYHGELGRTTNNLNENANPTALAVSPSPLFVQIVAGAFHSCGLTPAGEAYCWGWNNFGQAGGTNSGTDTPTPIPQLVPTPAKLKSIVAGQYHTCGLAANAIYCWGYNGNGQLGNSTNAFSQTPNPTPLTVVGLDQVSALVGGSYHACAVRKGVTYCWGYNGDGQLGTSQFLGTSTATPTLVSGGVTFVALAAGEAHSCGITSGGDAYCWGNNNSGQLGTTTNAGTVNLITTPTLVAGVTFLVK
jgi:alpha-tubulin suppressor-like RCC1 family protein